MDWWQGGRECGAYKDRGCGRQELGGKVWEDTLFCKMQLADTGNLLVNKVVQRHLSNFVALGCLQGRFACCV